MKLTVNFGRDEIMNAFRQDIENGDNELSNSFSSDDQRDIMQYIARNHEFEQIIDIMYDTFYEFEEEGLREIIDMWEKWVAKKKEVKPLKKFRVLRNETYVAYVEAENEKEASKISTNLSLSNFVEHNSPDDVWLQKIEEMTEDEALNFWISGWHVKDGWKERKLLKEKKPCDE